MSSNQVLTKKDVYEASWRWMQVGIGTFNYETQLALTNQYALRKALRKIYPNDEDYKAVMHNQMPPGNPGGISSLATFILGRYCLFCHGCVILYP